MSKRLNKDEYFLRIAKDVALRGTCDRRKVGCVITREGQILTTGYNGSIAGLSHCDDVGHLLVNGHCIRTIHAEINSIIQAALHGISTKGAIAYVTYGPPCWSCFKAIANAGIQEIIYLEKLEENYKDEVPIIKQAASEANINLYWWGENHELD